MQNYIPGSVRSYRVSAITKGKSLGLSDPTLSRYADQIVYLVTGCNCGLAVAPATGDRPGEWSWRDACQHALQQVKGA